MIKNRTILLSSIALAVFLLVVGTGLVTNAFAKNQATGSASKTPDLYRICSPIPLNLLRCHHRHIFSALNKQPRSPPTLSGLSQRKLLN